MKLYLIRHGAVTVRPDRPGREWRLSPEGRAAVGALAKESGWATLSRVCTSPEPKAVATAQRLAGPHELAISIERDLREIDGRAWVGEGYRAHVRRYLEDEAVDGWEARVTARERLRSSIDKIVAESGEQAIGVVSHGLILTLYVSDVLGLDAAASFDLWSSMQFPDVCVIDHATRAVEREFGEGQT